MHTNGEGQQQTKYMSNYTVCSKVICAKEKGKRSKGRKRQIAFLESLLVGSSMWQAEFQRVLPRVPELKVIKINRDVEKN